MKLSERLECIHDLIPDQSIVVDVGTDHGLLLIKALKTGKAKFGYALDIAKGPLDAAKKNIIQHGLEAQTSLQLRDGLSGFTDKANCYVVAGMGAETIWNIICDYSFDFDSTLILQSNTKNDWLRNQLSENSFEIIQEVFLVDRKIPTFIIVAKKNGNKTSLSAEESILGPKLIVNPSDAYLGYLSKRRSYLKNIIQFNRELTEEYEIINNYLEKE